MVEQSDLRDRDGAGGFLGGAPPFSQGRGEGSRVFRSQRGVERALTEMEAEKKGCEPHGRWLAAPYSFLLSGKLTCTPWGPSQVTPAFQPVS